MVIKSFPRHKDVINVDEGHTQWQSRQHLLHEPFEGGRSVTQTEWHYPELPEASPRTEGCLFFGCVFHQDLPIPIPVRRSSVLNNCIPERASSVSSILVSG